MMIAGTSNTALKRSITRTPKQLPPSTTMACDQAFRAVTRQCLDRLMELHRATCAGNAEALHEMRIALTRLRTAIAFFSPMVDGADRVRLSAELKWLHAHLGIVRDLDVAIARLMKIGERPTGIGRWKQERATCQRHLTRALRSQRYRRLTRDLSAWIENGTWSKRRGKEATDRRLRPIGEYSAQRLTRWRNKLVKKSGKLEEVGVRKQHRVRLINKKLTYALDAVAGLVPDDEMPTRRAALKQLRKAQKSLGQLNDEARYRSLAETLHNGKGPPPDVLLGHKRKRHLLHKAAIAYKEFERLKPFRAAKSSAGDGRAKAAGEEESLKR
jgi:CHAD domain-containing protein